MQCFIAGFDAFDKRQDNPSEQAVRRLPKQFKPQRARQSLSVTQIVLPTCCKDSWTVLRTAVDKRKRGEKFLVVLSGLGAPRNRINLERFALNMRSYRIEDNKKHQPLDQVIAKGGPAAITTDMAVRKISHRLNKVGLPSDVSDHAGTFVCNDVYYQALRRWQDNPKCAGVVFVHLPDPLDFVPVAKAIAQGKQPKKPVPGAKPKRISAKDYEKALQEYARALLVIAESIAVSSTD